MARIFVVSDDGQHIVEIADTSTGFDEPLHIVVCQDHGRLDYTDRSRPIQNAIDFAVAHVDGES